MRKRIVIIGAALLGTVVLFGNPNTAQAADQQAKATTSEMPAALLALGVDNSHVLTQAQAKEVRGQRHRFFNVRIGRISLNINIVNQTNIAIASPGAIQINQAATAFRGSISSIGPGFGSF